MKTITKTVCLAVLVAMFFSCATTPPQTRAERYAQFYEEDPLTFIIMPPINRTTNVDAKEYFYTTMNHPICEHGYYALPPIMTMDILRQESAYDAELLLDRDLSLFNEMLGADVCVFTIIKEWKKDAVFTNRVTVEVEYVFRSTKTNETVFHRDGTVVYSFNSSSSSSGWAMLIQAAVNKLAAALTDYTVVARDVNKYAVSDMPYGKYSAANYGLDKETLTKDEVFKVTLTK